MRFSSISITFLIVVWLQYPKCFDISVKKAKIEAENLVSEQRIIEANRNVTMIWGRNEAENVVWIMLHINAEIVSSINFQMFWS